MSKDKRQDKEPADRLLSGKVQADMTTSSEG